MQKNKKLLITLLAGTAIISGISLAIENSSKTSNIFTVEKVVAAKNPSSGYDTTITFKINKKIPSGWKIGFYSASTFKKDSVKNKNLTLNLIDKNGNTHAMQDSPFSGDKNTAQVFSEGTAVALQEVTPSALKAGTYTLKLIGNDQGNPTSYSLVPQGFFISSNNGEKFYTSTPTASAITLINQPQINQQISQHVQDNWDNSIKLNADDLNVKYHLVPSVASISESSGYINLNNFKLASIANNNLAAQYPAISLFNKYLQTDSTFNNSATGSTNSKAIQIAFAQNKKFSSPEQYSLEIIKKPNNAIIKITANSNAGAFYAIQTLRQLLYYAHKNGNRLPSLTINDKPRFKYRGVMLDVARHYFSTDDIKRLINAMAAEKLNVLHIHFSDDEAFRLSLDALQNKKASPGVRSFPANYYSTMAAYFSQGNLDTTNYLNNLMAADQSNNNNEEKNKNYPDANTVYPATNNEKDIDKATPTNSTEPGMFGKQSIKQLIKYANARNITIEPEIDIPAHAYALQHSMNFASDTAPEDKYISVQGFTNDTLPICNYKNNDPYFTETINNIIKEIHVEFSGQHTSLSTENSDIENNQISIGGDEVPTNAWNKDPKCNSANWPKNSQEKAQNFFKLLADNSDGIKLSGWQQILATDEGGITTTPHLNNQQTGYLWVWATTSAGGLNAAKNLIENKYHTVLAFADDSYFDLAYTPAPTEPGFNWANKYSDTQAGLTLAADATQVLNLVGNNNPQYLDGVEGALWSENMMNFRHLTYMALPKMSGLAEAAWSQQNTTTDTSQTYNKKFKVNWQSLATRLGCGDGSNVKCNNKLNDNNKADGHINYLYHVVMRGRDHDDSTANFSATNTYRGYPSGISKEIPKQ